MTLSINLVNIILGIKVRQARTASGLTLTELAARANISTSYLTEIEKGRKYPKADKILKMAEALGQEYDELVSVRLGPSLAHLEAALASPLIRQFPFEDFGVDVSDLVALLTRGPEQASALLYAVGDIARQHDMGEENFLRAALRSYQEIHDNYFPEAEEAARRFRQEQGLAPGDPSPLDRLKRIVQEVFGYTLDETRLAADPDLSFYRSVFVSGVQPRLLINSALTPPQIKFLLAREIGYQYLNLKERAPTSSPDRVESYGQVLNDYLASYFAGALLLPETAMLPALESFFAADRWQPEALLAMLDRFDASPEMLLYRFSELIPQWFGISLHFLRLHDHGGRYRLVKQLNMSRLVLPTGLGLNETFCRRWLTVRLLRELREQQRANPGAPSLQAGAQLSEFLSTHDRFLCLGFARPLVLTPGINSSVVVGFRVNADLRRQVRFLDDPAIPSRIINETCERCPLTAEQCALRSAPPTIWEEERGRERRREALKRLMAQVRG